MSAQAKNTQQDTDKDALKVTVYAPRHPKGRKFTWSKNLRVGCAAAHEFGYAAGTPTLTKDDVALDRDQELHAAGVRNKDELGLVDTGGGV